MDARFDLVRRVQSGEPLAAQPLVDKNYPAVYRLALSILDDPIEADQAAHEAGIAQLERLDAYPGSQEDTAWLYRITVGICRRRLRSRKVARFLARLSHRKTRVESGDPAAEEPDELVQAAAQLADGLRLVLVLRYGHDLLPQEIGQVLNWRESTVQASLYRARQKLRLQVEQGEAHSEISHAWAERLIESAADHAISDADAARLVRHLQDCPRCAEAARRLEELENMLRAVFHSRWMVIEPPEAGVVSIALDQRRRRRARRRAFSLGGGLLFTLLVVGLVVFVPTLYPAQSMIGPIVVKVTPTPLATPTEIDRLPSPDNNHDLLARVYPGKLAFITFGSLSDHLFTFRPGSRNFDQLTAGFSDDSLPAWSPDGRLVAFLSVPGGGESNQVYIANADGSHIQALPTPDLSKFMPPAQGTTGVQEPINPLYGAPHWSPDGQWLAMALWANSSSQFLVVQSVTAVAVQRLLPVEDIDLNYLAWSPDGSTLAYVAGSQHYLHVWWPFETVPRPNPLWMSPPGAWDEVFGLAWSPDSNQLAIVAGLRERDVMQVDLHLVVVAENRWQNFPVSQGILTRGSLRSSNLAWSPDGCYLALIPVFTDSQLKYGRIMLIPTGKGNPVPLVGMNDAITSFAWSPDSQWLAYSTGYEMWVASIAAFEAGQPPLARLSGTPGSDLSWQPLPKEQ
jgi:RNA polymerase sigma-70 factor (ECF subfamily)